MFYLPSKLLFISFMNHVLNTNHVCSSDGVGDRIFASCTVTVF